MSNVFKEFRSQKGMTQKEAGDLFGVSGSYWGELENDQLPEHKVKTYRIALKHINNASIYTPINNPKQEMLTDLKKMGLSPQQVEDLTGINASTWKNLAVGINKFSKKWTVLVNAAIIELAILTVQKNQAEEKALVAVEPEVVIEPTAFNRDHLRTDIDADNTTWFCLADICEQVDYKKTSSALDLISQRAVSKRGITDAYGRNQEAIFVTESGMYQFLMRCHLPRAEAFSDWVTETVLPTIRKTGSYSVQQTQPAYAAMPAWAEALLQQMGGGLIQVRHDLAELEAKIEARLENLPSQSMSADEAAQATLQALAALTCKKSELNDLVISIVNAARALPSDDPEAHYYSDYRNAWRTVHRHARPKVTAKDDYTSIAQVQCALDGGRLILARLGGCTQLAIDLGAA